MSEIRILPYRRAFREQVIGLTIAARTPVFAKTRNDVPRFVYDAFYPHGWQARQTSDVWSLLDSEPDSIWLAVLGDEPVGFAGIRIHPEDQMGEICIVAVSPDYQRQGIA